jgi:hypothetical protein
MFYKHPLETQAGKKASLPQTDALN